MGLSLTPPIVEANELLHRKGHASAKSGQIGTGPLQILRTCAVVSCTLYHNLFPLLFEVKGLATRDYMFSVHGGQAILMHSLHCAPKWLLLYCDIINNYANTL